MAWSKEGNGGETERRNGGKKKWDGERGKGAGLKGEMVLEVKKKWDDGKGKWAR